MATEGGWEGSLGAGQSRPSSGRCPFLWPQSRRTDRRWCQVSDQRARCVLAAPFPAQVASQADPQSKGLMAPFYRSGR